MLSSLEDARAVGRAVAQKLDRALFHLHTDPDDHEKANYFGALRALVELITGAKDQVFARQAFLLEEHRINTGPVLPIEARALAIRLRTIRSRLVELLRVPVRPETINGQIQITIKQCLAYTRDLRVITCYTNTRRPRTRP
ncbi:MAG: hypothetical protein Q7R83_00835 [bacterium]|nr:hypothetical protein [bacterium]